MSAISLEEVLYLHYRLTSKFGGLDNDQGVRLPVLLAAALSRPFARVNGRDIYSTPFDKAGILLFGLISAQCFRQNNEQTAIAAALLLLDKLGYRLSKSASITQLAALVEQGTDWRKISLWFKENCTLV